MIIIIIISIIISIIMQVGSARLGDCKAGRLRGWDIAIPKTPAQQYNP